ncbi:MAG TPA: type II secretion system protein GspF [Leucothrix mucor]|nr:type II secretion system protein GspF [Leucothrix mucor]
MPAYEYTALDAKGKEETGILDADNSRQLRQLLRDSNLTPLQVNQVEKSEKDAADKPRRAGRIKAGELALLTRQLATLVQSGAPLEEALATTAKQTEKRNIKHLLSAVRSKVVEGHTLADAFGTYPSVFPGMFRATVAAGEQSGHLDAVLERMADYTESRQEMQQKISGAMIYPITLTLLSIAIVAGLLGFIVPKIVDVFDNLGHDLPVMTRMMIQASEFIQAYGLYIGAALVLAFMFFKQVIKIPEWKYRYHNFVLKIPLIKKMVRGINTARFARTLSILSSSGVPILDAMSISAKVIQNMPMRQAVEAASVKVREGMSIHKALEQSSYFPPMTVYMIASGESSGKLDDMLERAAIQQERETDGMLTSMLSIFEPALILVMGGVVLLIVLSILLPILNMNQLVS